MVAGIYVILEGSGAMQRGREGSGGACDVVLKPPGGCSRGQKGRGIMGAWGDMYSELPIYHIKLLNPSINMLQSAPRSPCHHPPASCITGQRRQGPPDVERHQQRGSIRRGDQ